MNVQAQVGLDVFGQGLDNEIHQMLLDLGLELFDELDGLVHAAVEDGLCVADGGHHILHVVRVVRRRVHVGKVRWQEDLVPVHKVAVAHKGQPVLQSAEDVHLPQNAVHFVKLFSLEDCRLEEEYVNKFPLLKKSIRAGL